MPRSELAVQRMYDACMSRWRYWIEKQEWFLNVKTTATTIPGSSVQPLKFIDTERVNPALELLETNTVHLKPPPSQDSSVITHYTLRCLPSTAIAA